MARNQLGTVGAGNHYVDLFAGDDGSRVGRRALRLARVRPQDGVGLPRARGRPAVRPSAGPDGEMDSPPVLLHVDSELGRDYIAAMQLAGEYAYAGRDVVVDKVLEILGARSTYEVHNHHNFAWPRTALRRRRLGHPQGLHARVPGPGGLRRRDDGRAVGDPARHRRSRRRGAAALDRPRRRAGDVAHAGRRPDGQPRRVPERDCTTWVGWAQYRHERELAGVGANARVHAVPAAPGRHDDASAAAA